MEKISQKLDAQIVHYLDLDPSIEPIHAILDNKSYLELCAEVLDTTVDKLDLGQLPEAYAGCDLISIPYPTEFIKVVPRANTVAYLEAHNSAEQAQ